jgi:hypothetical protein
MKKLFTLLSVVVMTLIGFASSSGIALAYTPETSVESVPPGYRGHSYHRTQSACLTRGRNGQAAREFTFWECHQDGWQHPSLKWHLVVSQECPICRTGKSS